MRRDLGLLASVIFVATISLRCNGREHAEVAKVDAETSDGRIIVDSGSDSPDSSSLDDATIAADGGMDLGTDLGTDAGTDAGMGVGTDVADDRPADISNDGSPPDNPADSSGTAADAGCAATCTGKCRSCAMLYTGQPDGTCAPVMAGTDPNNACDKDATACGLDGQCDGAGACRYAAPNTTCAAEQCAAGKYTAAAHCDGAGKCSTPSPVSCGNYPCVGTRCPMTCAKDGDCLTGFYCANMMCVSKKVQGATCGATTECLAGSCVEGVCCDGKCDTKCVSCLGAITGQTDGKCAPVRNGVAHGTDCAAAASASCGLDGTCDGLGACRNYGAGTVCGGQTCPLGSSTYTGTPTCDGKGACTPGVAASCVNYLCNPGAATCKTNCSGSTDCSPTAYCAGTTCTAKKAPGLVCAKDEECKSGTCGGRCCDPGTSCSCPQPGPQNLLVNPGFDTGLVGWAVDVGDGNVIWSSDDSTSCAFSGSARITFTGTTSPRIRQCVSVSPSKTYNFGAMLRSNGGAVHCVVDLFSAAGCTGAISNAVDAVWYNVYWSADVGLVYPAVQTTAGTASAQVSCSTEVPDSWFDTIYLSAAPGRY
jgi:hypothetical protein